MSMLPTTPAPSPAIRWLKSVGAVLAGLVVVVALSIGTDAVLHATHVYPALDQPLWDPALNALALGYRLLFTVAGGWVTARLAPVSPMGHAIALAVLGLLPGFGGVIVTWNMGLGPHWYPIALAVLSPLAVLAGGRLARRQSLPGFV